MKFNLTNKSLTTKVIEDFIESSDTEICVSLDYTVLVKRVCTDDEVIDIVYRPYILLEKIKMGYKPIYSTTITKLKESIKKTSIKNKISEEPYTYTRDYIEKYIENSKINSNTDKLELVDVIDVLLKEIEKREYNELLEKLPQELSVESIFNEFELKNKPILLELRAQDTKLHNNSIGHCYSFNIANIGAKYSAIKNQYIEMIKKIKKEN